MLKLLTAKFKESLFSVIPIIIIVLILNFTVSPMPKWSLSLFLISSLIMVLGITLFNLGVDVSLIPIGMHTGSTIIKSKNLIVITVLIFVIGVFISMAEPDLIVLAGQINGVPDSTIIIVVSLGVGLALVGAILRILFQFPLSYLLVACYLVAFVLSRYTGNDFLSIAWESGGVTTGPIMVPFVMALGLGLAYVRGDKTTEEDSFGLISLCLIGPIITVLILGMFFQPSGGSAIVTPDMESLADIIGQYRGSFPIYAKQVAVALFPILLLFALIQIVKLRLGKASIIRIISGTVYTFLGLVMFLSSVNVGFMPAGYQLGSILADRGDALMLIPIGMVMGFFVVAAEPAVFVLKRQVSEITAGAISEKGMGIGLSIGVAISVGLAMFRVISGISLLYFIIPGYLFALILTIFVPRLFVSIAFDSGAVASGPLAATFLLPFAIGASDTFGGNIFVDAFGIVALIAMTPVITLQLFGLVYAIKSKIAASKVIPPTEEDTIVEFDLDENMDDSKGEEGY